MFPSLSRDCARAAAVTLLLATRGWGAPPDAEVADAARRQDRETVRALLARGADTNTPQPDGATALHWAVHWQDAEMAALLIRAGADVNAANEYGIVPLSLASSNGDAVAARLLLEAGANPNVAQPTGETPVMTAARTGDVDVLRTLIAYGADVNSRERQQEQTPLMWAIAAGHPAAARLLLDRGADPRSRSTRGDTALLFAARDNDTASARMLLDAGADIEAAASDGFTPLLVATVRGRTAVAALLLERGANPNHAAPGFTALHWASGVWETELTGPRGIAARRDEEWHALGGINEGKLELVKALLARGADVNARIVKPPQRVGFTRGGLNLVGATPYVVAAAAGDAAVMRLLADAEADPTLTTKEGTTALMAAAGVGRVAVESSVSEAQGIEAVAVALASGNDIGAANSAGDTALHGAATLRWNALVKLLAEKGAPLDAKNKRGRTPLSNAAGSDTEQLLRSLGATVGGVGAPPQ
jgi:ankyrin repeat protein